MVLTRRRTGGSSIGGVKNDTNANHESSFRDEEDDDSDFLSLRQSRSRATRSMGPLLSPSPQDENDYNYQHSLRSSRQRHRSRSKDHYSNGSALEKRQLRHSRQSKERDDHTRSLRSIGLDEELSSEEDAIATISASSSRGRVSKLSPRRSSRNRKTVFEKLSMSGIEGELEHKIFESSYNDENHKSKGKINPELRDLLVGQGKDPDDSENLAQPDIYTTIKARHRKRRPRRFFDDYELATNKKVTTTEEDDVDDPDASVCQEDAEEEDDDEEEEDENGDDDHEDEEMDRRYSLRTNRAQPLRLIYELQREPRRQAPGLFDHLPRSPVRRKAIATRRTHPGSPFQRRSSRRTNSQGASSGSTSSSDDETKFEKRKKRSMMKARSRCMPMNLSQNDLAKHGFSKERGKIGSSLADVDPMAVDKTVMFASVGGHQKHIRALKEMVVFPLLYPEVFEKFHISPPRGCLFYGPPGTGKTLMARALANECSIEGRKVAFFMRKGADCLSKWVGESERQLRLLFDQAYQMRPAIIFFDEIDGLAPVRSSRQDQIHSSIVSTLLALMDGLDSRGEIIVIGATNRIDSIDPALRRPGRFDREFLFPLPDQKARRTIFNIHTRKWIPPLSSYLLDELAEKSVGYCGADIKSACTEAAIVALRRRYPQIYLSKDKLKLDVSSIDITAVDFYKSMKSIVPTAQRSTNNPARALSRSLHPLLINSLLALVRQLTAIFPPAKKMSKLLKHERRPPHEVESGRDVVDPEDDSDSDVDMGIPQTLSSPRTNGLNFSTSSLTNVPSFAASYREMTVHRPRLLVCGGPGEGQTQHLASALLHDLEGVTVHLLDIPSMYGLQAQSPEEACAQLFREALRTSPSIVYMPRAALWWNTASETVRCTFYSLLNSLPASTPVLLIATADQRFDQVSSSFTAFFDNRSELFETRRPNADERNAFFGPVFLEYATRPPAIKRRPVAELEALEKAPPPGPTKLTQEELKRIEEQEESTMRSLRLFLRDVLTRLAQDRRFKAFLKPVDPDEVPDYADVISNPMDLSTMVTKIDQHKYHNVKGFQQDIDLICSNALEYNPDHCAEDKAIRHRACLLKDMSHAIIEEDLDPNFEKICDDVTESRKRRKADPAKYAPSFYRVLPAPKKTPNAAHADANPGSAGKSHLNRSHNGESSARRSSRKRKKRSRWALGFVSTKKRKIQLDTTEEKEDEENNKDQEENNNHDEEDEEAESLSNELTSEDSKQGAISEDADADDHNVTNDGATPDPQRDESLPSRDVLFDEMSEAETGDAEFSSLEESAVPPPEGTPSAAEDEVGDCLSVDQPIKDLPEEDSMDAPPERGEIKEEKITEDEDEAPEEGHIGASVEENGVGEEELDTAPLEIPKTEPTSNGAEAMEINWEKCNGHAGEHHETEAEKVEDVTSRPMTLRSRTRTCSVVIERPVVIPPPPLVVDNEKLKELLTHTVAVTSSCCVAELEKLHSILTRCVYQHRRDYDKTQLTKDLEERVTAFFKGVLRSDSGVVM